MITARCISTYETKSLEKVNVALKKHLGFELETNPEGQINLYYEGFRDYDIRYIRIPYTDEVVHEIKVNNPDLKKLFSAPDIKIDDAPDWFQYSHHDLLYKKEDFLDQKTFSELYLWRGKDLRYIYIYVHFFD